MKGSETRAQIVKIGREIIGQSGFNATGIDTILKRAGVPKGSFYYYFGSKEEFGLAVIDDAAREFVERLEIFLRDSTYPPLTRIRRSLEDGASSFESEKCKRGCLIGNMGQELAAQSETFRARLQEAFESWTAALARCLAEARTRGELEKGTDVERLAEFVLIGWEGALLRAKVMKSAKPLRDFIDVLFNYLEEK